MPFQTPDDLYSESCLFGPGECHRELCKARQLYSLASEVPRELHCTGARIPSPSRCNQFCQIPHVIRDPRFHGRCDPQFAVNPAEVIVREMER